MRKLWSHDVINGDDVIAFHCELWEVVDGRWEVQVYRAGHLWMTERFDTEALALAASREALVELNTQVLIEHDVAQRKVN